MPAKTSTRSTPCLARSGTSLHHQVYLVLHDRLLAGVFQAGEQLPPEPALCEQFGVSRITLRRAVSELEVEGLLERVQGKGTFVRALPREQALGGKGYVEDIRRMSADTVVRVLEFGATPAPEGMAARLGVPAGTLALRSVRLRLREGQPMALLTAWVPMTLSLTQPITRADLLRNSLYELLAQRGVRFGRVLQEIGASLADPLQAERLRVRVGAALLVVDRLVHDHEGRPVEFVNMTLSQRSRMVIDTPADMVEHVSSGRVVHVAATGSGGEGRAGAGRRR